MRNITSREVTIKLYYATFPSCSVLNQSTTRLVFFWRTLIKRQQTEIKMRGCQTVMKSKTCHILCFVATYLTLALCWITFWLLIDSCVTLALTSTPKNDTILSLSPLFFTRQLKLVDPFNKKFTNGSNSFSQNHPVLQLKVHYMLLLLLK